MEELEAPDGTRKRFRGRALALYLSQGWKPVKPKAAAKKGKAGSVTDDQPDKGKTQE